MKTSEYFATFVPKEFRNVGIWKSRQRLSVLKFTSEKDEGMKILVNHCIGKVEKIGIRLSKGSLCVANSRERKTTCSYEPQKNSNSEEKTVENNKRSNTATEV